MGEALMGVGVVLCIDASGCDHSEGSPRFLPATPRCYPHWMSGRIAENAVADHDWQMAREHPAQADDINGVAWRAKAYRGYGASFMAACADVLRVAAPCMAPHLDTILIDSDPCAKGGCVSVVALRVSTATPGRRLPLKHYQLT